MAPKSSSWLTLDPPVESLRIGHTRAAAIRVFVGCILKDLGLLVGRGGLAAVGRSEGQVRDSAEQFAFVVGEHALIAIGVD